MKHVSSLSFAVVAKGERRQDKEAWRLCTCDKNLSQEEAAALQPGTKINVADIQFVYIQSARIGSTTIHSFEPADATQAIGSGSPKPILPLGRRTFADIRRRIKRAGYKVTVGYEFGSGVDPSPHRPSR